MRTLKKTLCLVLCLAMMVGLVAIGASAIKYADYSDKGEIRYENAVKLLTALGVLEGDEKGFRPKDGLSRAEGAKIMACLMSKNIPEGTSSFTDMAGYSWAQKYVKFCEDWGIIAGVGEGKFNPGGKLTTTEWAKMLICALGYDAQKEGLEGATWAINTTMKVTALNLADGLDALLPLEPVTREAAAQLAYNTLFENMVYSEGSSYAVQFVADAGLPGLAAGAGLVTAMNGSYLANTSYDYRADRLPDGFLQFVEAFRPELKMKEDDDFYGIPTYYWNLGKNAQDKSFKNIICTTIAADVLAVYDTGIAGVTRTTIFTDGNFSAADIGDLIEVYENGDVRGADIEVYKDSYDYILSTDETSALAVAGDADYRGAQAILLDTDFSGTADRLVVKYPYLAKVIAVQGGEDRSVSLKVFQSPVDTPVFTYETEDFKMNDFVLVYPWGLIDDTALYTADDFEDYTIEVLPATANNGTLTKINLAGNGITATKLTVAGTGYPIASVDLANLGPVDGVGVACDKANYILNTGLTAYTNFGFILGVESDAVAYGDWVFLVDGTSKTVTSAFGGVTAYAGYVKQDASANEAAITNATYGFDPITVADELAWYYPYESKAGVAFNPAEAMVVEKPVTTLRFDRPALDDDYDIVTDSQTNIIIWRHNADMSICRFTLYKGYAAMPTYEGAFTAYALIPGFGDPDAHAVAVVIDVGMANPIGATADPVFVLRQTAITKELDGDTVVYTYRIVDGGEIKTVMSTKKITALESTGFVIPTYDATGKYIQGVTPLAVGEENIVMIDVIADGDSYISNTTLRLNGSYYAVSADTDVYLINQAGTKISKVSPDALSGIATYSVTAIETSPYNHTLKTIYFKKIA